MECETPAVWQWVGAKGETPANATTDPCRAMASITMIAMSWRFMFKSLAAPADRSKSKRDSQPHIDRPTHGR